MCSTMLLLKTLAHITTFFSLHYLRSGFLHTENIIFPRQVNNGCVSRSCALHLQTVYCRTTICTQQSVKDFRRCQQFSVYVAKQIGYTNEVFDCLASYNILGVACKVSLYKGEFNPHKWHVPPWLTLIPQTMNTNGLNLQFRLYAAPKNKQKRIISLFTGNLVRP